MKIKEGDMFYLNAPNFRGHFVILVRVENPWMYFYDTVSKEYFMTTYDDTKRAMDVKADMPQYMRGKIEIVKVPTIEFVKTIPDNIWFPLKDYCEEAMKKKTIKHRNFIRNL